MHSGVSGFSKDMEFPYPKREVVGRAPACGRGNALLLRRPAVEDCFCLEHGPSPEVSYMRYIRAKDALLYDKLRTMRGAMANRACSILEHSCNNNDIKMRTFHIIDYLKRGHIPESYIPLAPAKECGFGTPIEPLRIGLSDGWRDPELFTFQPRVLQIVDKNHRQIYTHTPLTIKQWFSPHVPSRSETEDTFWRLGLARMRNAREYLEPLPSSRLRTGDPNC